MFSLKQLPSKQIPSPYDSCFWSGTARTTISVRVWKAGPAAGAAAILHVGLCALSVKQPARGMCAGMKQLQGNATHVSRTRCAAAVIAQL
jgi:hypothetical protein